MIRKKGPSAPPPIPILSPGDPGYDTAQKAPFQLYPKQIEAYLRDEHEVFFGGAKGGGKAQPLDSKILTPFGWATMGAMQVGSVISNPTGGTATVIGVYPQGELDTYRITFSDGGSALATGEHLWLVRMTARKLKADRRYFPFQEEDRIDAKIYTTDALRNRIAHENGKFPERDKWGNGPSAALIPLTKPLEFSSGQQASALRVDPYVLGVLIGDGYLRNDSVTFSSADAEIVDLMALKTGLKLKPYNSCDYRMVGARGLREALEYLRIYGCLSHDKFIPDCYQWASLAVRWELAQGLMDTDGFADSRGHCSFTTVSPKLADDARCLFWSLGFKVSLGRDQAGYKKPTGEYVKCRDAYTLGISGPGTENLFKLSRKRERCLNSSPHTAGSHMRRMVSIEYVGKQEAQCIQVDHPNSLYITDDFVVTHNTKCGQFFLLKGNTHRPSCPANTWTGECNCCPPEKNADGSINRFNMAVNRSYIYHPKYLACVIRKNVIDLRDWIREAEPMYRAVGGEFKEAKSQFDFPSGATIYCGHYEDESTWMKYQGQNIVRFVLEELTQIPDVQRLKMLRSCCRSVYPEMRAQMFLTSNPGGPGAGWVCDRYIDPLDEAGNPIPPGTTITEYFSADEIFERFGVPRPATVPERLTSTRVFIPSSIKDNPAALVNPDYLAALADMDEDMREAYLYGNWKALGGAFFKAFRPTGPLRGEPPEANHVISYEQAKRDIKPWWWATAAMDWGYTHECAFGVGRHNQNTGQFIVTDELVVSETEPDVVGEEVARRLKPILNGLEFPSIVMGLSHDAYGRHHDDRSVAELIALGMGRILGRHMVHLPDLMVDELRDRIGEEERGNRPSAVEADKIFERIRNQQRMGITIKRMRDNRVPGWQLVRSMLRWKKTLPEIKDIYDANLASTIAYERGLEDYQAYVKLFEQRREILPKLLIVGTPKGREGEGIGCQRLIAAIPKAIRSKLNPEDVTKDHIPGASDVLDMLRYLCMTFKSQSMVEPLAAKVERRISEVKAVKPDADCTDLIWLNRKLEADAKRKEPKPINVMRSGRRMRAVAKGLLPAPNVAPR